MIFCMFAEDVGLLINKMFQRAMELAEKDPPSAQDFLQQLFGAMHDRNIGSVGFEKVPWFNGGLFDNDEALPMEREDIVIALKAAQLDWSDIDPSILGTLFERGLDPSKRSQLGAHYTDREKIMMIVNPVIVEPLEAEWSQVRDEIKVTLENAPQETKEKLLRGKELAARTRAQNKAEQLHSDFIERLANFRVLDPACGSGNFLYLSLKSLKDIEHKANVEAEALGIQVGTPRVGPEAVKGIEINRYAAELARVSIWIGEIQWMRANGFQANSNPILRPLGNIENRDALLNKDGSEAEWPSADVIVGNPPFLGAKLMKRSLGVAGTKAIRECFDGRLPGFTDLVCYWFEKARAEIIEGRAKATGLVATNSISKNTNLPVMRRIVSDLEIFFALSDEPWVVDGAAVRVSIICFDINGSANQGRSIVLDGSNVSRINPNLTSGIDLSAAAQLKENRGKSMLGIQKSGPFDINGTTARQMLSCPTNPNNMKNSAVLRPYWNGDDLTSRPRDVWFIDLPRGLKESEASLWEAPFEFLLNAQYDLDDADAGTLKEARQTARDRHAREQWWEPYWPRPEMRRLIASIPRYIVTAETAQHRIFVWMALPTLPDKNLIVFPRADDVTFGILHSRFHEVWALGSGSALEDRPRYTSTTTFETFPFPEGLTPDIAAAKYADDTRALAIAAAAERLNQLRENWLNPPDLVTREPEVVEGYPDRILPINDEAAKQLQKRTLTNLYNERPTWLDNAHRDLDRAVATAYGWGQDLEVGKLTDDEILARLFKLNQERSASAIG